VFVVWWQTLVVALSSSIAGGVLTSVGTYAIYLQQKRNRERHQAVETVAAALAALREIDPDVYAERLRLDDRGRELIADKRARWLEAVGRLEILAATHPGEIAKLSESVITKGGLVLIRLDEQVGATSEISMAWLEAVPAAYKTAVDDARKIARIVAS
jgi:hypothetical protein